MADTLTLAAALARIAELEKELACWRPIHEEIHRRADKEHCLEDRCDFTVTITHDEYAFIDDAWKEHPHG